LLAAVLLAAACGSTSPPAGQGGDVTGAWCGLEVTDAIACVGDEVVYAELAQVGTAVTGQSCERYMTGCYPLENGSLANGALAFHYTFSSGSVDAHLMLSADGRSLAGTYTSTKCACDVPVTLHRLP
jgi:hypothetical protein